MQRYGKVSKLNEYLNSLTDDEVQYLHDIALATFELQITNGDPETIEAYKQILQPAIQARACDGWLLRWKPEIYNN